MNPESHWQDSRGSVGECSYLFPSSSPAVPPWEAGGLYSTTGHCGRSFSMGVSGHPSLVFQGEVYRLQNNLCRETVQTWPARDCSLHSRSLLWLITSLSSSATRLKVKPFTHLFSQLLSFPYFSVFFLPHLIFSPSHCFSSLTTF